MEILENNSMDQSYKASFEQIDRIFHPRSIAIVGVSLTKLAGLGNNFLDSLRVFGFEGRLYPVNPAGGELNGLTMYRDIECIPDEIDLVINTAPARAALSIVEASVRKGVKAIHFFTSGFSETGEREGAELEAKIIRTLKGTGIMIIGPNCMGMYCPEARLTFMPLFPKEKGTIGIISQSGGNTTDIINLTKWRGARFSKVVSYGNGTGLDESDFLEYLTADIETRIIAMYIEGVKDGKRFRRALNKASENKTVILLKSGVTEGGARASVSHTAALAGNNNVWNALCKQTGVIRVSSLPELTDVLVTALHLPRISGRRAVLIGAGGGASVMITDEFESNGIRIPQLPERLKKRLREFTPSAGNMLSNPIDFSQALDDPDKQTEAIKILADWDEIDFLVGFLRVGFYSITTSQEKRKIWMNIADSFLEGAGSIKKPMAFMLEPSIVPGEAEGVLELTQKFAAAGFPVYYSLSSVARALSLYFTRTS